MSKFKNFFLIGPIGAGKTTVGLLLAQVFGVIFYDLDEAIEREAGTSISTLFQREGEENFRRLEEKMLAELAELSPIVLATGGGAVLSARNRETLTQRGTVIYLKVALSEQLKRLQGSHERPLLKTDNPTEVLEKLQTQREPLYTQIADYIINTTNLTAPDVVQTILARLQLSTISL